MDNSVTIVIRDLSTGAGRNGLTVWLRHKTDDFATNQIQATAVVGKQGVYEAPNVPYNLYKLWVNGSEDTAFGGTNGRWLPNGDEVIRLNGDDWDADAKKIINVADAEDPTDAMNQQASDDRYVMLDGTNDPALWLSVLGGTLDGNLLMHSYQVKNIADGTDAQDAVSKAQLDALAITPYQESPNEIRLIPGGSTKTGQVYTTWNAAMGYLKSLTPSATKRFVISIGGVGISGATSIEVTENDGGSPPTNYFNAYISLFLKNRYIKLEIPDDLMTATANTVSIEGGTIYKNDAGADPVFENLRFVNVYFDLTVNTVTFTACIFENCFIKVNDDSDGSATFTSCKGSGTISNQDFPTTIKGWPETPKEDF